MSQFSQISADELLNGPLIDTDGSIGADFRMEVTKSESQLLPHNVIEVYRSVADISIKILTNKELTQDDLEQQANSNKLEDATRLFFRALYFLKKLSAWGDLDANHKYQSLFERYKWLLSIMDSKQQVQSYLMILTLLPKAERGDGMSCYLLATIYQQLMNAGYQEGLGQEFTKESAYWMLESQRLGFQITMGEPNHLDDIAEQLA